MGFALPAAREMFSDATSPRELADKRDELLKTVNDEIESGLSGETYAAGVHETGLPILRKRAKDFDDMAVFAKGDPSVLEALKAFQANQVAKEITLTSPLSTGLIPFDLEAPAKLLAPRPTPFRNTIARVPAQGGSRRFKVINGFTGTGTGGVPTLQPGITESSTNVGPGGLAYIRPPYIQYNGYDVVISYVSWGLSDAVSWQAQFQGQGYEDARALSSTALLYATMLIDERLMCYGRGTTGNGYAGALTSASVSLSATAASNSPQGTSTISGSPFVIVAPDAGDLLGTNGTTQHQGPATTAASVAVSAGQCIQVNIVTDSPGALGYNLYVASVVGGPYYLAGRTGYNVGFITSQPSSGPTVTSAAGDTSAVATNFDGLLTNVAASGGYVTRLNNTFSTANPGVELQTAFSSLFDSVKADPDEVWLSGHDRNQLANAFLAGGNVNNYRVYVPDTSIDGVRVGAMIAGVYNQITGKELSFNVHPWFPQGNMLIRSQTLPLPDSNVSQTSVMTMVQDYMQVNWPVQQFTYDSSVLEIGSMAHYAPTYNGLIQGIKLNG